MSPENGPQSSLNSADAAARRLLEITQAHSTWFISQDGRAPLDVNRDEFDFSAAHGRLIFSCRTEQGALTWKVNDWSQCENKLVLRTSRRMGAVTATIEMAPRSSAKALVASIAAARLARCEHLAKLMAAALGEGLGDRVLGVEEQKTLLMRDPKPIEKQRNSSTKDLNPTTYTQHPSIKIERATLSPGIRRDQPGRYARIILRPRFERIAVTAIVAASDARNVDSLFSSALLWFERVQATPKRPPINRLLIVVEKNILEAARQRLVLLRDSLRGRIELLRIDEDWSEVESTGVWERRYLWRKRLSRFPAVVEAPATDRIAQIVALAPNAIDVVASRHGQTLRYHGLPFARMRRVMDRDHVWFGIEGSRRRLLGEYQQRDFAKLLGDLQTYRNESCRDRRHWFYRAAGEAWLESILRRDISRLDPGLVVAPLHAQFRTSPGGPTGPRPIDLLALRRDGRLVVIELKVSEDRQHVFQGVDYWRRVEAHRRRGHISSRKLFGDREISDESPLVYLVAPTLRFHPSFTTLARTIARDIEIYRFDINEDWRGGVRVVRRERTNA
ncbi:MAG TPA: hypothetical protein VE863_05535 [Pyrinomonadaceae bacterium]|jgi:hypothetical protein|nr:hypothetical protein [Pyrinomonadaceae bacterium]